MILAIFKTGRKSKIRFQINPGLIRITTLVRTTVSDVQCGHIGSLELRAWSRETLQGRFVLLGIELRHLYSVIVLAEEMHFTRAAHRLRIAQPSLSKRIQQIERLHGVPLFARDKGLIVELTDAGRIFVEEARLAIFHAERALNLARAADRHSRDSLVIGYSPDADYAWVSSILATRPPSDAKVRIRLCTRFAMELVHHVLVGEMNLALVTAPPKERRIIAVPFARRPLYAVLPDSHRFACRKELLQRDQRSLL